MLKSIVMSALVASTIAGCINGGDSSVNADTNKVATIGKTTAVVVGMENSRFAGSCPGARLDSDRMYSLLCQYADTCTLLQDGNATKSAVASAMQKSIEEAGDGGLFILYYSGHGGSDKFVDTGSEEVDGKDEYLCLWDTYMRDNDIWSIIVKSKSRVLVLADCCHSCTIYRGVNPLTFRGCMPLAVTHNATGPVTMQCWSGCPDNTYSYGSDTGGQFTNALLRHFKDGMTYDELWKKVESDRLLQNYEKVQRTVMGEDFGDRKIFR